MLSPVLPKNPTFPYRSFDPYYPITHLIEKSGYATDYDIW